MFFSQVEEISLLPASFKKTVKFPRKTIFRVKTAGTSIVEFYNMKFSTNKMAGFDFEGMNICVMFDGKILENFGIVQVKTTELELLKELSARR